MFDHFAGLALKGLRAFNPFQANIPFCISHENVRKRRRFFTFLKVTEMKHQSLFQLLLTPSTREQLFLRNSLPYSFLKTSKTTCRLGERSFQVPKLWVKIYNFAYLLEFVVHFCLTARMPLHSTRSTEIYKLERIKSKHFPSKK